MAETERDACYRWDEIELEKVTEMVSRKIVTGAREMLAQIYLKKGALVPMHSHESEQITYILQGALKFLVGGEEVVVREGEVLTIPSLGRAPGRGARGHVRARPVQPDPSGLAGQDGRLLPPKIVPGARCAWRGTVLVHSARWQVRVPAASRQPRRDSTFSGVYCIYHGYCEATGLAILRILLGVFFLVEGIDKLSWLIDRGRSWHDCRSG